MSSAAKSKPVDRPGIENNVRGVIDSMTRRDDRDVFDGHFCRIDLNHKGVPEDLVESGLDYGVYVGAASVEDNRPVDANVRLRESGANVVVPYESLRPAEPRGR